MAAMCTRVISFSPATGLHATASCLMTSCAAYRAWAYDDAYVAGGPGAEFSVEHVTAVVLKNADSANTGN